ncbi:SPBc2 prophage-derived endonuclease YokF precursor [Phycisphaerae bacterium RAS1]|nr:SPBc2 prophage-derived endonuclease YokF precursor [Phycisphaerae bacterium RAS1]
MTSFALKKKRSAATRCSRAPLLVGVAGVGLLLGATLLLRPAPAKPAPAPAEQRKWVEVERVLDGDTLKVDPGDKLVYAGIRAPVEGEPFFEQARRRNAELVEGKKLRLRFDGAERDKKQRLCAYAFLDDRLVNAVLVSEGLAYVRRPQGEERYIDVLLKAQSDARRSRRGVWSVAPPPAEPEYAADPKYGNFHRPSCGEVAKMKPERLQRPASRDDALSRGFAPCPTCRP